MKELISAIWMKAKRIDWQLLAFLLLVLNVKLVVKLLALILITAIHYRSISIRIFRQRYLWFYLGMIFIGLVNLTLGYKFITLPYALVVTTGVLLWMLCAVAAFHSYRIIQKGHLEKLVNTVTFFFLLHIGLVLFNFLCIVIETGSVNPYTYKGLNQKYFVSTGDYIKGITFDSPVSTAMICAFGILFFLYTRRFFYSLLCMIALLIMASSLTNFFLFSALVFVFIFRSDRVQKSMIVVYSCLLLIFYTKVSTQNNEHVISFVYKLIGKPYYLPPIKILTNEDLKSEPDSLLTFEQKRIKRGLLYIDSSNSVTSPNAEHMRHEPVTVLQIASKKEGNAAFYEYKPSEIVKEKENRFGILIQEWYSTAQKDSLDKLYNWEEYPGKWIAYKELVEFLKSHKNKVWLGAGISNFSSRMAFKASAFDIAGSYPVKYRYIHPHFRNNYFYIYLYYHAQWQFKHTAANTPDSAYSQLAGEYGIAGLIFFIVCYCGYFIRRLSYLTYGLPLFFMLLMTLSVEYWFEQLSVVILFELLIFLDIRLSSLEGQSS